MLLIMLWSNTILTSSSPVYAYKWEIVGFRAAWVSVTQLPLIYCLSCKINVISLITGISYERLNWFHRWAARTLFLTVIVHWSFFFHEWSIANFVKLELSMMPIVKYGFGAWSVIGWMVITGFGYFRTLSHELFVLQHIAAAGILLWLVHVHVPSYAAYNVWLAVGFVAFDWIGRIVWVLARNLHIPTLLTGKYLRRRILGFPARAKILPHGYLSIIVEDVDFSWRPGQHVYLTVPRCGLFGLFEAHPFTVASLPGITSSSGSSELKVFFKAHSGFTKRMLNHCLSGEDQRRIRVFLSGPWGNPPLDVVQRSDSLILFACSTGASFTLPILQSILLGPSSIRRIRFYWIVRHDSQIPWLKEELDSALSIAQYNNLDLLVRVFVTAQSPVEKECCPSRTDCKGRRISTKTSQDDLATHQNLPGGTDQTPDSISGSGPRSEKRPLSKVLPQFGVERIAPYSNIPINTSDTNQQFKATSTGSSVSSDTSYMNLSIFMHSGRPTSLDDLIRPTVEESDGETAIVACGSKSLLAELRNYTAALSDERAAHKGTGAQGIFLFTENYGW